MRLPMYDLSHLRLRFTIWKVRRAELRENGRRLQGRLARPQGCPAGAKAREASLRQAAKQMQGAYVKAVHGRGQKGGGG